MAALLSTVEIGRNHPAYKEVVMRLYDLSVIVDKKARTRIESCYGKAPYWIVAEAVQMSPKRVIIDNVRGTSGFTDQMTYLLVPEHYLVERTKR